MRTDCDFCKKNWWSSAQTTPKNHTNQSNFGKIWPFFAIKPNDPTHKTRKQDLKIFFRMKFYLWKVKNKFLKKERFRYILIFSVFFENKLIIRFLNFCFICNYIWKWFFLSNNFFFYIFIRKIFCFLYFIKWKVSLNFYY